MQNCRLSFPFAKLNLHGLYGVTSGSRNMQNELFPLVIDSAAVRNICYRDNFAWRNRSDDAVSCLTTFPTFPVVLLHPRRFVSLELRRKRRRQPGRRGRASICHQSTLQFRRTKLDRMAAPGFGVVARFASAGRKAGACIHDSGVLYANVISTCVATSDYAAVVSDAPRSRDLLDPLNPVGG